MENGKHSLLSSYKNELTDKTEYKVIFCLGNPGSGKNTQCDFLKERFSFSHYSCGDLLRAEAADEKSSDGELINYYIKEGKIVPAKITCSLAKKEMEKKGKDKIYLVDGFPRNSENLEGWLEVFGTSCYIIGVIFLDCSDDVCLKRLKKRAESSGRIDDNEESIRKRFRVFTEETLPNIIFMGGFSEIIKINSEKDDRKAISNELSAMIEQILKNKKLHN